MSALNQPIKPFTIPTGEELNEVVQRVHVAASKVEEVYVHLLRATGNVKVPLLEFAARPTLEDLGALYSFASYAESVAASLKEWAAGMSDLLPSIDMARREWDEADTGRRISASCTVGTPPAPRASSPPGLSRPGCSGSRGRAG